MSERGEGQGGDARSGRGDEARAFDGDMPRRRDRARSTFSEGETAAAEAAPRPPSDGAVTSAPSSKEKEVVGAGIDRLRCGGEKVGAAYIDGRSKRAQRRRGADPRHAEET